MTREVVRRWKRTMRTGSHAESDTEAVEQARDCAIALVNRSISFSHGRLAVLRLVGAVRLGAKLPQSSWEYCRTAAEASRDPALQELFTAAVKHDAALKG